MATQAPDKCMAFWELLGNTDFVFGGGLRSFFPDPPPPPSLRRLYPLRSGPPRRADYKNEIFSVFELGSPDDLRGRGFGPGWSLGPHQLSGEGAQGGGRGEGGASGVSGHAPVEPDPHGASSAAVTSGIAALAVVRGRRPPSHSRATRSLSRTFAADCVCERRPGRSLGLRQAYSLSRGTACVARITPAHATNYTAPCVWRGGGGLHRPPPPPAPAPNVV